MMKNVRQIAALVAVVSMLLLAGCNTAQTHIGTKIGTGQGDIITVEHDGHLFVVLSRHSGYAGMGGICHHPDCPKCKEEQGELVEALEDQLAKLYGE